MRILAGWGNFVSLFFKSDLEIATIAPLSRDDENCLVLIFNHSDRITFGRCERSEAISCNYGSRKSIMPKTGYVYIMTNRNNTVLYTGVTSDLKKRAYQHQNSLVRGFTKKYNCHKLVYFECHKEIIDAITREKQIKAGSRKKKEMLIQELNPEWNDLSGNL